jgi:hypothetical protein
MELSHGQRHQSDSPRPDGSQRGNIEAVFRYCVFDRRCRRDVWLGVSLLVDYHQVGKVVDGLAEILS